MNLLFNNQDMGELEPDAELEHSSDEDWKPPEINMANITSGERLLELDLTFEPEQKDKVAQDYFKKAYIELSQKEKFLCDLKCELDDLETVVDRSYIPSPTSQSVCFFTSEMNTKLEQIYTEFANEMTKISLDMAHKPLYWDLSPAHKLTRNGKPYEGMNGLGLTEDLHEDYQSRKLQEISLYRNYVFEIFHDEQYDMLAMIIYVVIVLSIIISVTTTMISTVPSMKDYKRTFDMCETTVTICFTVEYVVKMAAVRNRLKYAIRPMNILDLFAILPFYMTLILGDLDMVAPIGGVLRALRLTRIAKIRQLSTPYTNIIMQAMIDSVKGTGSAVGIFLFIGTVMMGTLVFAAEKNEDSGFISIPMGMWFAIVTITTVGYGDYFPTSTMGYMLGTVCILFGLILTSLIIMVIGQYYIIHLDYYIEKKERIKALLYGSADGFDTYTVDERMDAFKYLMTHFKPEYMYQLVKVSLRRWEEEKNKSKDFALSRKRNKSGGEMSLKGRMQALSGGMRAPRAAGCTIS